MNFREKAGAILRDHRGELFIEELIGTAVSIVTIMAFLSLGGLFLQKKSLDNYAIELTRYIQVFGEVDDGLYALYEEMVPAPRPTIEIETDYIPETHKVQLGNPITVRLRHETSFMGFPLSITGKGVGICEVYHKE